MSVLAPTTNRFPAIKLDLSNIESFWLRVGPGEGGCWLWRQSLSVSGYGSLFLEDGRRVYAHRFSYELANGPIPAGLVIDHLCRNKRCVRPEHLEPVTQAVNTLRGMAGYHNRTTCKHGHDITDPSRVYTNPTTGLRDCRECMRRRWRAVNKRRRESR